MTQKEASRFLLWAGEKTLAGDAMSPAELEIFREAREVTEPVVCLFARLKPEDYEYTPGQPFR